ncbi:hypothetical protein FXO38_21620 [Capsicum annuum]|nr:hypothetical protein FXO38_21620 [Capsicum annuum]
MIEMHRAWDNELPPPLFPTDNLEYLYSLPPVSHAQFPIFVDTTQHASGSTPGQQYLNTSNVHFLTPQYKTTTYSTPPSIPIFATPLPYKVPISEDVHLHLGFKIPKFKKYDGYCDPVSHLRCYSNQLRGAGGKEELLMAYFDESLSEVKDSFTPIGESCASLFQRLVQRGMISHLLGYIPDPYSRSFDPNIRCAYHSNVQGHSIEDYSALKREIEKMVQDKEIMVQNIDSEESSSHADMQTSG